MKEKAIEILGAADMMISGSKPSYSNRHPNNLLIFNANV